MDLRLGVHLGQQNMSLKDMRALWRKLDEKVDWISIWDHFYEAPPAGGTIDHYEAMTAAGALAAETKKAILGVLVFYVGYRNPASIAKAATTLDHISGGRFELGLGGGWHVQEARAYGYDFPSLGTRLDMLDEATSIIRGMLTQERTTFEGKYFHVDNASNLPHPVQTRMPIWIGGIGEKRTLDIVARQADGWNAAYVSVEEFARLSGVLDDWCERHRRDPQTIARSINLTFHVSSSQAEIKQTREKFHADWGPLAPRVESGALLCTPSEAVDRINAYREAGASMINVALRAPWNQDALDSYLEEVIPTVKNG